MGRIILTTFLIVILVVFSGCSSKEKVDYDFEQKESVVLSGFIIPEFKEFKNINRTFSVNQNGLDSVKYKPISSDDEFFEYYLTFSTDFNVNKDIDFLISNFECLDASLKEYETDTYFERLMNVTKSDANPKKLFLTIAINDNQFPSDLTCEYSLLFGNPRQAIGSKFFLKLEK